MQEIDITDIPLLVYDPGLPDTQWGEETSTAITSAITSVIILLA